MNPRQGKKSRFQVETLEGRIALSSGVPPFGLENVIAAPAVVAPEAAKASKPTLQFGARGEAVKELQRDLVQLGYKIGRAGVDGIFGPDTQGAVKAFQMKHPPLGVDGIVGPKTWAALERSLGTLAKSTNFDWARWVLHDGKWPESRNNITVITQWMASEEPTRHWWNRNNPLNNGLGSGGGSGLGSYPNLLVAAHYVALNLEEGTADYGAIVADLKASAAPSKTARAIWDSPWAASHYGYGRAWHSGPVATVAAPSSAWR